MDLINKIQSQIESLYGIKIGAHATDYLITQEELKALLPYNQSAIIPKELFLVNPSPQDDTLEVALFLDPTLQQNLNTHNPLSKLNKENISDFCTLIEGISHFVYYLHKASLEFEITELELELQAEVDKFLLLALCTENSQHHCQHLIELLFEDYDLHAHLTETQKERYHTANDLARKFCFEISKHLKKEKMIDVLKEIRNFYPMTQEQKIRYIMN